MAEYLVDLSAIQAAMRAGYSADTASQIGYIHIISN
ncbi:terminase small subunit [Edaphobacter paludis]